MRILLISDKFIPERGGSQIILGKLYAHLAGHEVTVVTRQWPGAEAADRDYPQRVIRVPFSNVPKLRSPLLWYHLRTAARRLLQSEQFDQVHCGQVVETAPWGVRLAREFGLPSIVHTFAEDITSFLKHPMYLRMMRSALDAATHVTTISCYTRDHLHRLHVAPERISLLYPGVTFEHWHSTGREQRLRERYQLEGKQVILTLARLIPRKGQDTMLRALPQVLKEVPNAVYLCVGGGPEEARLRTLANVLGVNEQVRWVGSIPNHEAVDYYHAADVFAMPNRQMPNGDIEGFGLVFLEANACAKPVIAGRSGGAVDAVEHERTGYLVDPESPTEVADRLISLLRSPELAARLGEAGRQRVIERFTWQQSCRVLNEAIQAATLAPSRPEARGALES